MVFATCDPFASVPNCPSTPTMGQFNAEVVRAVGDIFGAFLHGGPPLVLGGLIVVWALGRVFHLGSLLVLRRLKKERREMP